MLQANLIYYYNYFTALDFIAAYVFFLFIAHGFMHTGDMYHKKIDVVAALLYPLWFTFLALMVTGEILFRLWSKAKKKLEM